MPVLHDNVFDAALNIVKACTKAQVVTSGSSILINSIVLNSANYSGPGDYASGGRKIQCLVSSSSDMLAISVTTGGAAKKIRLLNGSSVVMAVADLTSAVSLGSSDQVNLGTFSVILADPT